MRKSKTEYGKISVRATLSQINELKKTATAENKSISVYVRDRLFSQTLDTARIDFYQNINDDLIFLKRSQQAVTYSLIFLMTKQLGSKEKALELFKNFIEDAEKKIKKNDC